MMPLSLFIWFGIAKLLRIKLLSKHEDWYIEFYDKKQLNENN